MIIRKIAAVLFVLVATLPAFAFATYELPLNGTVYVHGLAGGQSLDYLDSIVAEAPLPDLDPSTDPSRYTYFTHSA